MAPDLDPPGPTQVDDRPDGPPAAPGRPARQSVPTWAYRLGVLLLLALAVGILWFGGRRNDVGTQATEQDPVVAVQIPAPGAKALRQTQVGAELATGYDGRLVVNGVTIPEDQMEGAVDPAEVSPEDIERYGIRPNNRNRVFFTPGPGQVIEEFDTGPVEILLTYFKVGEPGTTGRSITWTVNVD